MRLHLIAFTENGIKLSNRIAKRLDKIMMKNPEDETVNLPLYDVEVFEGTGENKTKLSDFVKNGWGNADALIFIGATGIAIRGIAPFVKDKTTDPAVIVIDDTQKFVIPLLSGHIGGANSLALTLSKMLKATPVITTATDNNNVFAIDSFAVANNYSIRNTRKIKSISSNLLKGISQFIYSDFEITSPLPTNIVQTEDVSEADIIITDVDAGFDVITLVPKIYSIGIGCKKRTKVADLFSFVSHTLEQEYISPLAIESICSIDVKKEERAILSLSKKLNVPFKTFSAKKLNSLKGDFTASSFVAKTVGTDNVCERSAVCGNGGELIVKKISYEGMTIAISKRNYEVKFDANKKKC